MLLGKEVIGRGCYGCEQDEGRRRDRVANG